MKTPAALCPRPYSPVCPKLMPLPSCIPNVLLGSAVALLTPIAIAAPATASLLVADIFHTLSGPEETDTSTASGQDFIEDIEAAIDDVNQTIGDVTTFPSREPFVDMDSQADDFEGNLNDTMRNLANDADTWFD